MLVLLLPEAASASTTTRIIVKREPGLSAAERAEIRADAGVQSLRTLSLPRTEVVTTTNPGEALAKLQRDDDVVYAEPDHVRRAMGAPDPAIGALWAFRNTGQVFTEPGTPGADSDILEAWDLATGVGQVVAVVDTGIIDHEDLAGQVPVRRTFVGSGPDADGAPDTSSGHGTHVSGTIAALRYNGKGAAGVAPAATLMALKALSGTGSGHDSDIVDAFHYAALNGARVVNASFVGPAGGKTLRAAIAAHPEVLFVVGAGNDGTNNDAAPQYPCNVPEPNVLCVGASTNTDHVATFFNAHGDKIGASNVGARSVDLFAPGRDIYSAVPAFTVGGKTHHYALKDGTSMAAPHVAAAAALVMDLQDSQTPKPVEVKRILMVSGDDVGTEFDAGSVSGRRLDARAALDLVVAQLAKKATALDADWDKDGWPDEADACPKTNAASSADGCPPDDDWDGIPNDADNCDVDPNVNQANADGDLFGDVCDSTPRGHNNDGDHRWQVDDACPDVYGTLANGCPAPAPSPPNGDGDARVDGIDACPTVYALTNDGCPLPQVASVAGKVRKRGSRRSVTVKVATTRLAMVRVTIQRKKGGRWVRVARATRVTVANRVTVKASRLKRGRHRVRVSVYNGAGSGSPVTRGFRVR